MNKEFFKSKVDEIIEQLDSYVGGGLKMFATSSFQGQSLPLLHILGESGLDIPVVLTDTGFLFPETTRFANVIAREFGLNVTQVRSVIPKSAQRDSRGCMLYSSDPDLCCEVNKVEPMNQVLMENDVWINGIRADQSNARKALATHERTRYSCVRYHPMLNWSARDVYYYRKVFSLPDHPLEALGYSSIGCMPCTRHLNSTHEDRNARWYGMSKTECGLNTDLILKSPSPL
jgi:phosphoadenosine phosphosulfate reductase